MFEKCIPSHVCLQAWRKSVKRNTFPYSVSFVEKYLKWLLCILPLSSPIHSPQEWENYLQNPEMNVLLSSDQCLLLNASACILQQCHQYYHKYCASPISCPLSPCILSCPLTVLFVCVVKLTLFSGMSLSSLLYLMKQHSFFKIQWKYCLFYETFTTPLTWTPVILVSSSGVFLWAPVPPFIFPWSLKYNMISSEVNCISVFTNVA